MKSRIMIIKKILILLILKLLPISKNKAYFMSFHGMYSDNSKYISEYISHANKNIKLVWEISSKSLGYKPENILTVKTNSFKALFHYSTSKYLFDNYSGFLSLYGKKNTIKTKFLIWLYKKHGQKNYSFWHGIPFKTIKSDDPLEKNRTSKIFFTSTCDCMYVGSQHLKDILNKDQHYQIPIKLFGSPRIDQLILKRGQNDFCISLKKKLNLPIDKKVVLFAPTFRPNLEDSGINQMKLFNISILLEALEKKFSGEFILIVRFHDSVLLKLKDSLEKLNNVFLGDASDDMTDYLTIANVLITDYSASIYEAFVSQTPCFLFCHDFNVYNDKRGLYFEQDKMPIKYNTNFECLISSIKEFDSEQYAAKTKKFLDDIGCIEKGDSCEKIYNDIFANI